MEQFKAGTIQFDIQNGRIQANMDVVLHYLDVLAGQGVSLAVLPEMFSCSFDNPHLKQHALKSEAVLSQLSHKARRKNIAVAGSLPVLKDGRIFNTMVYIDTDGEIKAAYQKLHLFKPANEDEYFSPGSQVGIVDTCRGKIGLMICYDLRFPELSRALALNGVTMLLVSAQWPFPREKHWQALLVARAVENQLYVIGTNRTGQDESLRFPGRSMIIDPVGNILSESKDTPGTGWGWIDPDVIKQARMTIPCMADRRPDIYG